MDPVLVPTESPRHPAAARRPAPWPIRVHKYGGTSVGDVDRIGKVAARIERAVHAGEKVVVTVSAMGRTTDRLLAMAREVTARPARRELDVLLATGEQQSIALVALALQGRGISSRSLTGAQAGFLTDSHHGNARILEVDPRPVLGALEPVDVVVVAGFQGADTAGNITTLGRGGSDTTAVALAAALGVPEVDIYTDTDGVYTTDPHRLSSASKLAVVDYDEMIELASQGAKVLHPRSVWYARRYEVRIHVRSSFGNAPGTIVTRLARPQEGHMSMITDKPVTGVALDMNHARVDLHDVPDKPGVAALIFGALGSADVSVDMIIQGVRGAVDSRQQMAFIVGKDVVAEALEALGPVLEGMGARAEVDTDVAKLSIVGIAIGSTPGVAARMFDAVAAVNANIDMITTSEVRISVLIPAQQAQAALEAVHTAFGLDAAPDSQTPG
ncbi:MAG: aspartate kinase [Trueperaceae bacterium]|nr:aspartate kinase [Truepera sp.]HRN17843.1 aspartate kinase [Trueperaceae bacterium]HRQ09640.1 aspartate kinase [Trueperaceae bacterium]